MSDIKGEIWINGQQYVQMATHVYVCKKQRESSDNMQVVRRAEDFKYELLFPRLGSGGQGAVHAALSTDKDDQNKYAIKIIPKKMRGIQPNKIEQNVNREIKFLSKNFEKCIAYYGPLHEELYENQDSFIIVTELMEGGSL